MPPWSATRPSSGPDYSPLPPPHRLSSLDDPYALTLSSGSPRHSVADFNPSPRDSFIRVDHADAVPDRPLMSYNNSYQGYTDGSPHSDGLRPKYESQSSEWLAHNQSRSRRTKWIVTGCVIAVIVIVAVAVGVTVSKNAHKSSSKTSSGLGSGSNSSAADGVVQQTNPNDPSSFVKDDRLKKSFYGFAYTPENSQFPDCGNKIEDVITDIQLLSQLTDTIRLYGADCNQASLVLEAIKQTKVDMKVFLGNYPIPTDSAPYVRQRDAIIEAVKKYGTDHIAGITVGNEFILNWMLDHQSEDANSPIGNEGAQLLIANITDMRQSVAALNLPTTIPIGTSDAGSYFNTEVLSSVDYGMSNVHAWFANVSADGAADWVADFFQENNVLAAQALPNQPKMYIAETGWPTASKDVGNERNGPTTASLASEANLQTFLNTFVCPANKNNTGYFYFEFADENWKDIQFGGVEGHWGIFYPNRTLKNIEIPQC